MGDELRQFFTKDGSIGLIVAIGHDGARFKDIEERVVVSHDTVSRRMDEARALGLINTEAASDVGTTFRNTLTPAGEVCYLGLVELGIDEIHQEYVEIVGQYQSASREYTEKVSNKEEWFDWFVKAGVANNSLLYTERDHHSGFTENQLSELPNPFSEAVKQRSVEPLMDAEDDIMHAWLWEFMFYPPKPNQEDIEEIESYF